ncbi:hypothetical protein MMC22_008737 [Lobaria immixta]|nr:hypothetical protein [Lobaria immixta]
MASPKLVPALPPPPGQTSNFVDPDSLYKWNVLCVTMCLVFTTLVFVPRTYVRLAIKREWILEDCTYSLAVSIANLVDLVQICAVSRGAPIFSVIGFVVRVHISASPDVTYNQPEILLWAAAELSTGIICVCLPTLAALRQCRPKGPSESILNGISNTAHAQYLRWKQNPSLNDRDLLSVDYVEMEEGSCHTGGGSVPTTAVNTGIDGKGNKFRNTQENDVPKTQDIGPAAASREELNRSTPRRGILKTTTIEQSLAQARK